MQLPQKTIPKSEKNTNLAIIIIIIGAFVSGAMTTMIKIGLENIPLYTFSFLRMLIALIVIIPFYLREKITYDRSFTKLFGLSVLPFLNILFFSIGIRSTTASIGQTLYAATPLLTAFILVLVFHKQVAFKKIIYITLGFIGASYIILLPVLQKESIYSGDIKGNMFIFIAVICWSLYTIFSEEYQKKYSPIIISAVFTLTATILFFILSIPELLSLNVWLKNADFRSLSALFYVGIFGTFGGYLIHQYAIKYGGPILASVGFYLLPITAYISSFIFLGEKLTVGLIIGFSIIIISVFLEAYDK